MADFLLKIVNTFMGIFIALFKFGFINPEDF